MGATDFSTKAIGKTAKEAFNKAVSDAKYAYGNEGYTGTIAEKPGFKMVKVPAGKTYGQFVNECFEDEKHLCNDKWGDAACIDLGNGEYLFFGLASS